MKIAKLACALVVIVLFASTVYSMSGWNERRGVWDDICYLRQAHLFQRFGVSLDTDIRLDDDQYLRGMLKDIGWLDPVAAPGHRLMATTGKVVMQFPPGTGFLLSLFPEGHQVSPLSIVCTSLVLLATLAAIVFSRTGGALGAVTVLGTLSIYFMINPNKASYSIAPTVVVCIIVALLTVVRFREQRAFYRSILAVALGGVLGLAFNLRLANTLLSVGYSLLFLLLFLRSRSWRTLFDGLLFGAFLCIGALPVLIANKVNGGSPFTALYSDADASLPVFTWSRLADISSQYLLDTQGVLILIVSLVAIAVVTQCRGSVRALATFILVNMFFNVLYFVSHPFFTQYYLMPIAMLSAWSLLFGYLLDAQPKRPEAYS